jgi:quercetin dioxygenase-like cupin family protein
VALRQVGDGGEDEPMQQRLSLDIGTLEGYEGRARRTSDGMEALKRVFDLNALATGEGIEWKPWREGIAIHRLYGDGRAGASAALLRYDRNAMVPLHEHAGHEHIFVLSGSQEDGTGVYRAGSMVVSPPGSRHSVRSAEGCIVLVLWEQPIILVDAP